MNTLNQEADMGYVRDFVAKVAEALVAATELPKQIEAMRADLNQLASDLGKTKAHNLELDTMLADTRRQRDEAEQALSQVKNDLSKSQVEANNYHDQLSRAQDEVSKAKAELEKVRSERDDYGLQAMSAEDRASQAEAKLAKLAEALGLPKPEPKTVLTFPPEPALSQSAPQSTAPQAVPEPTQAQLEPTPPKRVYEGDLGFGDLPMINEHWDPERKNYYRTA